MITIMSNFKKNFMNFNSINIRMLAWKELVFKMQLSEAEYKLLLQEKSRGVINFK